MSRCLRAQGAYAARFELHQTDRQVGNGKRSEVVFASGKLGVIGGPDEWYGFSLYLPPGYVIDTYPMNYLGMGAFEMLAQWHSHPDTDEVPPFPPLALMTDKGHWKVINRYSGAAMLQSPVDGVTKLYDLGPYAPGAWTDFVVHIRWSCRDAPPLAERCQSMPQGGAAIWKDGKQLVNYTGPTAYNDKARVFLKTGVYKGMWKVHTTHVRERVVYQDEFRIGDATSSYAEVAPPGRPGPQPPGDSTPPGAPLRLRAAIPAPQ